MLRQVRGQHLDGDLAFELSVARAIDLAHAARAQRRDDLVRSEHCARRQRHQLVSCEI